MAKTKATHMGECQACGRTQKLPSDRLSIHGYTVQWSMFVGTCPGSHNLPYEQSCDMLPALIERSKRVIEGLRERIARLRTATTQNALRLEIRRSRTQRDVEDVTVTVEEKTYEDGWVSRTFSFTTADGFKERIDFHRIYGCVTPLDVVNKFRAEEADFIERTNLAHYVSYLSWLTERLANWSLKPLRPVVDEASKPVKAGVRRSRGSYTATVTFPDGTKAYAPSVARGWHMLKEWREQHPEFTEAK